MADKINKPHVGNWDGKGALSKSISQRMGGIIGSIDKEERDLIHQRIVQANSERVTLRDSNDTPHREITRHGPSHDKRRAYPREVNLGCSVLGFSSAQSAGEFVIREIIKRQEVEMAQGATVIHVKDGKPLTAHGAKLLGVPWPPLL